MSDLTVFSYANTGAGVRTVVRDGDAWFVAADVCGILSLGRTHDAVRGLDEDERGTDTIRTPGGDQEVTVINEPGLYSLILRSRKPEAKAFKRWVTHEVLPAIRKTGRYETAPTPALPQTYTEALRCLLAEVEQREATEAKLAEVAPAAEAWNHLATASGDYAVADAAKILSRHPDIKIGRDRLFTVLARERWIYRRLLDSRWAVLQSAIERGWLSELASSHYHPRTGELVLDPPQVRVTVKGLAELQKRLTGTQGEIAA
jgi:anti-repressor protein